jgi:hypothetical protein
MYFSAAAAAFYRKIKKELKQYFLCMLCLMYQKINFSFLKKDMRKKKKAIKRRVTLKTCITNDT